MKGGVDPAPIETVAVPSFDPAHEALVLEEIVAGPPGVTPTLTTAV